MSDRLLGLICVVMLLAVVLFGTEAHAQPIDWSSYQLGRSQSSYYQGTAPNGERWTGQSHTSGHTTYFDAYGPNGASSAFRPTPIAPCRSLPRPWSHRWEPIRPNTGEQVCTELQPPSPQIGTQSLWQIEAAAVRRGR